MGNHRPVPPPRWTLTGFKNSLKICIQMERDVCGRCSDPEALGLSAHNSILAKSITYTLYSVGPLTHPPFKPLFPHQLSGIVNDYQPSGRVCSVNIYISAFLGSSSHSFLFSFFKNNFYVYLCMCVCTCMWYLFRLEEGVGSSGARITSSCQPHPGYSSARPVHAFKHWATFSFSFFKTGFHS